MDKKMTVDDLLNMEGSKVPNDSRSYSTLVYGPGKIGKSSLVHELYGEKVLFLALERRHAHLPNVHVINIDSYPEYLKAMKLLKDDRLKEKYSAVCIDTLGRLEDFIREYTLRKLDIDDLGDLPYGAAYGEFNKELEHALRLVEHSGYVPVFIAHSKTNTQKVLVDNATTAEKNSDTAEVVKDKKDGKEYLEYSKKMPDIREKFYNMLSRIVDNVLFLDTTLNSNGEEERRIFYRDTPHHTAGASFANMPESTKLSSKDYEDAMEKAIASIDDGNVQEGEREQSKGATYDFDSLMKEAGELGQKLQKEGRSKELSQTVEEVLGKDKKVKDLQPDQAEILSVFVDKLKDLV